MKFYRYLLGGINFHQHSDGICFTQDGSASGYSATSVD